MQSVIEMILRLNPDEGLASGALYALQKMIRDNEQSEKITCKWTTNPFDYFEISTSCDKVFELNDRRLIDSFDYCPFCGKEMRYV